MENSAHKILLVDDEPDILEFLGYNLEKDGYCVLKASDGNQAIRMATKELPHLIILDVMMPGLDGFETCRLLRKTPGLQNSLIIFLSARSEDLAQISGFEAGADDYIGKPVKPVVLRSKIKALLRRSVEAETLKSFDCISISNIFIDKNNYDLQIDGKSIVLSKKEFDLLFLLLSHPSKVFTREDIFSSIWGTNVVVGDRTIDVHIRRIRSKTGIQNIATIKGVGYKYFSNEELQS